MTTYCAAVSFLLLHLPGNVYGILPDSLSHAIAFLKGGEVWISGVGGQEMRQFTSDSGNVDDYLFAPSLNYLAYAKITGYADEPGLWDDTDQVPQRAISSIVIMEVATHTTVTEISPAEGTWIYLSKWLPDDRLLFYGSSGFDVSGFYIYDIPHHAREEVEYNNESIVSGADYSADGSLKVYVDDSGLGKEYRQNLHLVDLKTSRDRILLSRRSIEDQRISNDRGRVAFVEVEEVEKKYFDRLWMYDIGKGSLSELFEGPAMLKSGGKSAVSWSPDDRYIGMFFPPKGIVIDLQHRESIHRIQGADFSWIDKNKIIFAQGNDIFLYNPDTDKNELLIRAATKPASLLR